MTRISVIVPFWNCTDWALRALRSLALQSPRPDQVLVVDDASTQDTSLVEFYCKYRAGWRFVRNEVNVGKALNLWNGIASFGDDPEQVVLILDGDDFLAPHALRRIAQIYEDPAVWVSYGQYTPWPENTGQVLASAYPDHVLAARSFRNCEIHFNHPLSFRKKVWDHLSPADLQDANGAWFPGGADFVVMVPLMELAGREHLYFNEHVIYHYNAINPLADNVVNDGGRQGQIVRRSMKEQLSG